MLENGQFNKELLEKIKEKKIEPKPRWHFLLKDYVVWFFGAFSLVIGGLAVSVILYLLRYNDWDLYDEAGKSIWEYILLTLPYFWVLLLGVFVFLIYYNLKNTKKGYKYSWQLIFVIDVFASIVLGGVFFKTGVGQALDDVLGANAPYYSKIFNPQIDFWSQPKEGRLAGLVVSIQNEGNFMLIDLGDREWLVNKTNAEVMPMTEVVVGRPIRVIGEEIASTSFLANKILSITPPGRGLFNREMDQRFPPDKKLKIRINNDNLDEKLESFSELLEKYPELQQAIYADIVLHQDRIEMFAGRFPELDDFLRNEFDIDAHHASGTTFKIIAGDNQPAKCDSVNDCHLPFEYAVRSNCPFEAACVNGSCQVVCSQPYESLNDEINKKAQCNKNGDCDCNFYLADDMKECICFNSLCTAVVK